MVRVETGSRLHFGLLRLVAGGGERRFGGAGLMIGGPGIAVRVEPADDWSAEGPLSARALDTARAVAVALDRDRQPRRILVERAAPEHAGLGTGTQLALAVARAVTRSWRLDLTTHDLTRLTGRGKRSGIGVHGFARGGFLVDGGRGEGTAIPPLLAQVPLPSRWRILVVLPPGESGMAGASELDAFARLEQPRPAISDALCRLLVMGVLPALAESDFGAFSESIFEFNAGAGDLFAPAQGGTYSNARTASLVEWLRREGVAGAGQSSWGPGVFGFVEDEWRGVWLRDRLAGAFPAARIWLTSARERGADLTEESPS